MVVRDHPALSLSRQCRLLSLGRSSLYYTPKGESAETLALMRRIDKLFLKYPFYGARRMALHLRREGVWIGRRRAARLMSLMGLQAIYRAPRTSAPHPRAPDLPLSAAGSGNRAGEPCLVRRHHLHPGAARLPLPGGDHGLGEPVRPGLASVEHTGTQASAQTRSTRPWPCMASRRYSTPTRVASSPALPSPGACKQRASGSRWMAGAGAWTTSSSSGLWRSLKYEAIYLHEIADGLHRPAPDRRLGPLLQPREAALGAGRVEPRPRHIAPTRLWI